MSEDVLQKAEKRNAKGKEERKRYTQLSAELESKARRHKKAFLSEQCKEKEENNRTGKTRDLFKKIGDTHLCHAKMSMINDRNGKDLTGAEKVTRICRTIQKRLSDPNNMMVWSPT